MVINTRYALAQGPDRTTGDAISQQVRDQIDAARKEAQDAARGSRPGSPSTPPLPGTEPVTVQQIPFDPNRGIPTQAVDLSIAFFVTVAIIILGWPIMRAIARRMDRGNVVPKVPAEVSAQLVQLSQAVDAIALEVERISEGQRFTTRLLSEQRPEASKTMLAPAAGERT